MTASARLLVVDDALPVHQTFERVFRRQDPMAVRIHSAMDGGEAVEALRAAHERGERFDVAFVDVCMSPGPDGFETARRLRAIDPDLPVVICTAYPDFSWTDMQEAVGTSHQLYVVAKPFTPVEVQQAVATCAQFRADDDRRRAALRDESARRERAEVGLRHAQKLEAIGELAAGVAHEINTPIQFVGDSLHFVREGFDDLLRLVDAYRERLDPASLAELEALEQEIDLDFVKEESPEAFAMCTDGIERVARIVKGLKAFSHHGDERGPADLNQAVRDAVAVARHTWKTVAKVELDLADIPHVHCAVGDINQVLLNLVVNAAHAIEDKVGGSGALGRILVRSKEVGDQVHLSVSDTGCGIPDEVRMRVFEPFFTTKPVGRGTGQGLAIAYALIVDGHNGHVSFDTSPEGTTFTIQLPIREAA